MAADLAAYLQGLIGKPWDRRGTHCWALVQQVEWDLFDRAVPIGPLVVPTRDRRRHLFSEGTATDGWREADFPEHGAIACMYRIGGNPADIEHAGVCLRLETCHVLHTDYPHGVALDTLLELKKVRGWIPRWFVPREK